MATEETRDDGVTHPEEIVLHQQRAQFEKKYIELTLSDNHLGRYARLRECGKRFNNIIIPECGFQGVSKMWQEMMLVSEQTPQRTKPVQE